MGTGEGRYVQLMSGCNLGHGSWSKQGRLLCHDAGLLSSCQGSLVAAACVFAANGERVQVALTWRSADRASMNSVTVTLNSGTANVGVQGQERAAVRVGLAGSRLRESRRLP